MHRSRKIVFQALALVFALSTALSGCGSSGTKENSDTGASTKDTTQAASTTAAPEPYEAVWYTVGDRATPDNQQVMDEIAKVLKSTNTTLKFNVIPWGEYSDKMSMIIASGEPFDYCFMAPWTNYYQNVAKGAFADLTDLYDAKLPKLKAIMQPELINGAKVKGKIYGLPTVKEIAGAYGFDVDKEYAKQLGVDLSTIKTWADIEPALKLAKEKLPGITPFMELQNYQIPLEDKYDILLDDKLPGAIKLDDGTTKVVNQFESQEYKDNVNMLYKWYKAGYVNKNPSITTEETIIASGKMFARAGAMGPSPEWLSNGNRTLSRVYVSHSITTGSTANAMVCVSKSATNIDRALSFFDEISTNAEAYNLLCYGIEGKHYQIIDNTTDPKTWDYLPGQTGQNVGYLSGGAWTLGGNWFCNLLSKTDGKTRNADVKTFNEKGVKSPLLGFSVDTEPIKTEIAACQNVYAEVGNPVGVGQVDPAVYLPKFLEKLKAAGSDKIIAEVQKQVDEWRKANGK